MRSRLAPALARLGARRSRTFIAAAGIVAAAVMAGTATTIAYGLATGFDRASESADAPDLIAEFGPEERSDIAERISRLPNVETVSYRREVEDFAFFANGESTDRTAVQVVGAGRRGYEIVEGSDVTGAPGEVVIERGVATEWDLEVGDSLGIEYIGSLDIVGISVSPDNVAFPLNSRARAYLSQRWVRPFQPDPTEVDSVLIWANDPSELDSLLVQARNVSFGLSNLKFSTREGVQALVDRASGIVIALLIAFSLVAVGAAGMMLGATARADVQRRLESIGVMRAVGVSRRSVVGRYAVDAALLAVPASIAGLALGTLLASGPSARLLEILNEKPPGAALLVPLLIAFAILVSLVVAVTLWPAWRAAGRPPAEILRGAELTGTVRRSRVSGGPFGLGLRLAAGRRGRTLSTAAVVAAATSVVLLMLAMASFLEDLEEDPGVFGKSYELLARAGPDDVERISELPGVAGTGLRYELDVTSPFSPGEPFRAIAFEGDHTRFEAPPLAEGRRAKGQDEAEVGVGLVDALGLQVGSTLVMQLPTGGEARYEVVGVVRAISNEGRLAYVGEEQLLAADPDIDGDVTVDVARESDTEEVTRELAAIDIGLESTTGTGTNDQAFLGVLADLLRVVAGVNVLICLYALVQALAVTAAERRPTIAVLRASGASRTMVMLVMLGAASAVIAIAAPAGVILERAILGPIVANLAAGYADVPLGASPGQIAISAIALAAIAAVAAATAARRTEREPIALALREE